MTPYPPPIANPYQEYLHASQDYWLEVRGAEDPPSPTYRLVKGRQRLGRYLDPYGCLGLMAESKHRWTRWYTGFLIGVGISLVFVEVDWIFLVCGLPFLAGFYLIKRARLRARYDYYWSLLQEIERTGEPVWVAYSRDRLQLIERRPQAVWP